MSNRPSLMTLIKFDRYLTEGNEGTACKFKTIILEILVSNIRLISNINYVFNKSSVRKQKGS